MNYAGLGLRVRAFLWDYLLILGYLALLTLVSFFVPPVQALFGRPLQRDVAASLLLVLPVLLYFARVKAAPARRPGASAQRDCR